MKFPHKLRGNSRTFLPSYFFFVDTETYQKQVLDDLTFHILRLGWVCYVELRNNKEYEEWFYFKDVNQFWDYIENKVKDKRKYYLFAHNMHFDFFVLQGLTQLNKRGWVIKKYFIDSNVFYIEYKKDKKKLIVIDSGNILKIALRDIAKHLGMEKLKVDFETVNEKELKIYCKRDVEILKTFILEYIKFIRKHDLGTFKFTLAGQAMQAFKHKFMKHEIFIHSNKRVIELERNSYFGGRNEVFKLGKINTTVYYLDVNSLYPYVMREYKYPVKLLYCDYGLKTSTLKKLLEKFCVIAYVRLNTKENAFPYRYGNKLLFPLGSFYTYLCTQELKYALDKNYVKEVFDVAVYDCDYIFKEYVDFFYNLKTQAKKDKDKVTYLMSKLLLNSLYGKFGQKSVVYKKLEGQGSGDFEIELEYNYDNKEIIYKINLGNDLYIKVGEQESFDSFVAIASHVTSYARMVLYNYMLIAGKENVYYCDTDSLFTNEIGYNRLKGYLSDYELGKLKLEKKGSNVIIYGCKDYVFDSEIKRKGIKSNAKEIGKNKFVQMQFLKFKSMLRNGYVNVAVSKEVEKQLKRTYDKAIVTRNNNIIPFFLVE